MEEITRLIQFSDAIRESTMKRLVKVTPGYENWRVNETSMSFTDIAMHLIECDYWLIDKFANPELKSLGGNVNAITISNRKQYEEVLNKLKESAEKKKEFLRNLNDNKLTELIYDERFNGKVSKWWVIVRGNLDHEIHHRGQISIYLKLI